MNESQLSIRRGIEEKKHHDPKETHVHMQISYRHDRINAGWFVVEELQSTIENEYETAMGNGCMSVFGVRLGHHRRDGEAGSER